MGTDTEEKKQIDESQHNISCLQRRVVTAVIEDQEGLDFWKTFVMQTDDQGVYLTNRELATQIIKDGESINGFNPCYHGSISDSIVEKDIENTSDLISRIRAAISEPNAILLRSRSIQLRSLEFSTLMNPQNDIYHSEIIPQIITQYNQNITYKVIAANINAQYGSPDGSDWINGESLGLWVRRNADHYNLPPRQIRQVNSTPNFLTDEILIVFTRQAVELFDPQDHLLGKRLSLQSIVQTLNDQFNLEMTVSSFVQWRVNNSELVPVNPAYKSARAREEGLKRTLDLSDEVLRYIDRCYGTGEFSFRSLMEGIFEIQPGLGSKINGDPDAQYKTLIQGYKRYKNRVIEGHLTDKISFFDNIIERERKEREFKTIVMQAIESALVQSSSVYSPEIWQSLHRSFPSLSPHRILVYLGYSDLTPDQQNELLGLKSGKVLTQSGARKFIKRWIDNQINQQEQ